MKVYCKNEKFFMDDQGRIVELTPNEDYYLKLPSNSVNRVWVSCAKVLKQPNQILDYGDEVKEPRILGSRNELTPRKGLEEYLEGEDKETYLKLVEKAKANRAEANKKAPMTELEKTERKIERLMAKIESLKKAQG